LIQIGISDPLGMEGDETINFVGLDVKGQGQRPKFPEPSCKLNTLPDLTLMGSYDGKG